MKKTILILALLSLPLSKTVTAGVKTCSNPGFKAVDLSKEFGPIKNQGTIGWCYAYAASDLLTHYLYKTKGKDISPKKLSDNFFDKTNDQNSVSSVGIAYYYYKRSERIKNKLRTRFSKDKEYKLLKAGFTAPAMEKAMKKGFFFDSIVNSYSPDFEGTGKLLYNITLFSLDKDGDKRYYNTALESALYVFPRLSKDEVKRIFNRSNRYNVIDHLLSSFSSELYKLKTIPKIKDLSASQVNETENKITGNDFLFNRIDELLESGTPVAIGYYAKFLTNKEYKDKLVGAHASTIVGKRINSNCDEEYIIRNSFGNYLGSYLEPSSLQTQNYYDCGNKFMTKEDLDKWVESFRQEIKEYNQLVESDKVDEDAEIKKIKDNTTVLSTTEEVNNKIRECLEKNTPEFVCEGVSCNVVTQYFDPKTPLYLYVTKNELKKYLFDITYIEEY